MSHDAATRSKPSITRFAVRSFIVLLVLCAFLAYTVFRMTRKREWSREDAARFQVHQVWQGVANYLKESPDRGRDADFRAGFESWWGEPLVDIWGSPVEIRLETRVVVSSAGPDLEMDTPDDIRYSGE